MPEAFLPITTQGTSVANLFLYALLPSALILLLVYGVIAICLIRFRGRPGVPDPEQVHGNRNLEITWTVIPIALLVLFFNLTLRTMSIVDAEQPSALRVQVIGHQWFWEFRYPDLGVVTANELHLPVDMPVQLQLMSEDVIHSFWVPRIGWKKDVIPGKLNTINIHITEAGVIEGACAEYCGNEHAWMRIRLIAEPADRFNAWVSGQASPAVPGQGALIARGQHLFMSSTCVSCHTVAGTNADGTVGPNLSHLGSRETLGAGVITNTPENLMIWIHDAQAIKPGIHMPAFTNFTGDDLAAIAAYLDSLK
ncbi:MAG: cytochrome c oxidase subunit II [Chloroflexi bacterium]|nr:cytochrome c oxidase subunit II [Chloroflexota bacterium]